MLSSIGLAEGSVAFVVQPKLIGFNDSKACRVELSSMSPEVIVVVINHPEYTTITPINLAAALCQDSPERDVYLWENQPSASLVGRARLAGVRGVINSVQLNQLLSTSEDEPGFGELEAGLDTEPITTLEPGYHSETLANRAVSPEQSQHVNPKDSGWQMEELDLDEPVDNTHRDNRRSSDQLLLLPLSSPLPAFTVSSNQATQQPTVKNSYPSSHRVNNSNIIGVFSGRGGVGKSTISLLMAVIACRRGLKVALVDADLQFGDIAYMLGHAAKGQAEVMPLLAVNPEQASFNPSASLIVLAAPESVEQSELISNRLPQIVQEVAQRVDLVLINTSAFWTSTQAELARVCSKLIFLMDQRTTSIKACQQVAELCIKLQIPEAKFVYVLNGCHRFAPISPRDASLALGGHEVFGLEDGGNLVDEMLSLGCPEELVDSGNTLVQSLDDLVTHLLPQTSTPTAQAGMRSIEPFGFGLLKNILKRRVNDVDMY